MLILELEPHERELLWEVVEQRIGELRAEMRLAPSAGPHETVAANVRCLERLAERLRPTVGT